MKILVWARAAEARVTLSQSSGESFPVMSFLLSKNASLEISRVANCSRLISREKNTTLFPETFPAWSRTFRAKEVLPMPGRAARRMSSPP